MRAASYLLVSFTILLFVFHCGPTEPESPYGSLRIVMEKSSSNELSKTADVLESVRAIVKKGSVTVYDGNLTRQGGGFHGEINNLEPGSDYSVQLFGYINSRLVSHTFRSGISVQAGEQTTASIPSWTDFLTSPVEGAIINNNTPTFDWSDINGAIVYELMVDNSTGFESPEIHEPNLSSSRYIATNTLSDGAYFWKVRARDSNGNWGSWSEDWYFVIQTEDPTLCVSPTSLDFGSVETSKTFDITNCGTGTLTWNITVDSNWISVSPTSGSTTSETDVITVTLNRSGLNPGDYNGTVTVNSNGGTEQVSVAMNVPPVVNPILCVSPTSLDFANSETSKTFNITNCGTGGTLTWNITDDTNWITVSPTSGSTTAETDVITVTVNRSGLSPGNYSGTVTVNSNGGTAQVGVSMSVVSEIVSTPNPPTGQITGKVGQSLCFSTGGSTSNLGHSVGYRFDWGDGNFSNWSSSTQCHIDTVVGTYSVKAQARCQTHTSVVSDWSLGQPVTISGHTLSISVSPPGSGSLTKNPNKSQYNHNETVQLTAGPNSGYQFGHWEGDLSGSITPENIRMDGDKNVTAYFIPNEPNNTANECTSLGPISTTPITRDACIDPEGDIDYYCFSAIAGQLVQIRTQNTGSSNLDGAIWLYNSSGTLLAHNDDDGSTSQSRVEYTIQNSGTYYIRYAYYTNSGSFPNSPRPENQPINKTSSIKQIADPTGTYRLTVQQLVGTPNLNQIVDLLIDDDNIGSSIGNGDGIVQVGETIELRVRIQNNGNGTAYAVSGQLSISSTDAPYCEITDASEGFPDIPAGSSDWNSADFDFRVTGLPPGNDLDFTVTMNYQDGNANPYNTPIDFPVAADYAGRVELKSSTPRVTGNMSFSSSGAGYDPINPDPPHWRITTINGYMEFQYNGLYDFVFHALGSTVDGISYCYIDIYVNNVRVVERFFVDKNWTLYWLSKNDFGFTTGTNTVRIVLVGDTHFWSDEAYIDLISQSSAHAPNALERRVIVSPK